MALVRGSSNFHTVFDRQIKRAQRTSLRFDEMLSPKSVEKWWPNIRMKLRQMLIANLERIHDVPIKDSWRKRKKKMIGNPNYTFVRKHGGPDLPVISSEPWIMTGTMKREAQRELKKDAGSPQYGNLEVRMSLGMESSDFVPDEVYLVPYPEAVDKELMKRSGGEVGMVQLDEQQISEIIEMLVKENEDVADRIFRGVVF